MSDTAYAGYWEKILPKRHIIQGLRQDVLDWLIQRQSAAVAKYGVKDPRIAAFVILDDVIADQKTIRWSADLARFFVQGKAALFLRFAIQFSNSATRRVSISISCSRCLHALANLMFWSHASLQFCFASLASFLHVLATQLAARVCSWFCSHASHIGATWRSQFS